MAALYQRYARLMFFTARRYIDDPHTREEVVQDALMALIPHVPRLRAMGQREQAAYIWAAVRSRAVSCLRAIKRAQERFVSLDAPETARLAADTPSLDEWVLRGEIGERLRQLWDRLPPEDQLLLEGRYILGCSDRELAAQLGCKPDSVRMKLTRARRRARAGFSGAGDRQIEE